MASVEYRTFTACTKELVNGIAPHSQGIALDLQAAKLIPPNVVQDMQLNVTGETKATELVTVLGATISDFKHKYHDAVKVLRKNQDLETLIALLDATYKNAGVKPENFDPLEPKTAEVVVKEEPTTVQQRRGATVQQRRVESDTKSTMKSGDRDTRGNPIRETGRKIAKAALDSAVKKKKEEDGGTKPFHIVLALLVVVMAVGASVFTKYIIDAGGPENTSASSGACTEIKSSRDLESVLEAIGGVKMDRLCSNLKLLDQVCIGLESSGKLNVYNIAVKYMEQNPTACWEKILKILRQVFHKNRLAKETEDKYGVPDQSKGGS